ncbi:MAG: hypothetical protein HY516_02790 [Candidatus Aenigmarchaeota archaeon]|nr:hypothetical protein [Candidatus Aenigmarchaeota archaeon]
MKAITPVIALVMLVMITVGIVGVSATWFSGVLSGSSEKAISILSGGVYCNGPGLVVTVLNLGASSSITASDIKIFKVDGNDVAASIPTPIKPGEGKTVINGYLCGGTCAGAPHDIIVGTSANVVQTRVACR